jgi:hypothetical protein
MKFVYMFIVLIALLMALTVPVQADILQSEEQVTEQVVASEPTPPLPAPETQVVNLASQLQLVDTVAATPVLAEPTLVTETPSFMEGVIDMFSSIETRTLALYSFKEDKLALGATATFPVYEFNEKVSLTVGGVLISDDGLSIGGAFGLSVKEIANVFDGIVGWSPAFKLFVGIGINKRS